MSTPETTNLMREHQTALDRAIITLADMHNRCVHPVNIADQADLVATLARRMVTRLNAQKETS